MTTEQPLLGWEPTLAERLRGIDPALLGRRVRAARVAAGLTQTDAGGPELSTAYVSRIEAGARRPSARALQTLAERTGTTPDVLLRSPEDDPATTELRLTLDYAELALETGEAQEAVSQVSTALGHLPEGSPLRERALFLHGRALEATGRLAQAVTVLEQVVAADGAHALRATIALCRCLRESGELDRAIDEGDAALARLRETPLYGTDESIQLVATVASCYFESGDVTTAARLCREAVATAEQLGSATARASAYWNASIVESHRGRVDSAVFQAQRALSLLGEGRDARNLARLRIQLGILQLRSVPPAVAEALSTLRQAETELQESSAAPADLGHVRAALARAHLLDGDLLAASEVAEQARATEADEMPLAKAEAAAVLGQVAVLEGDTERAKSLCAEAALLLSAAGADRATAQVWYELAMCLEQAGATAEALDAYRRAAASTGLTTPAVAFRSSVSVTSER
ncbi:helix-turn-helix domain-containing protein [Nocardioides marmoribigeumensis]|uniref:Tetratricopeptide (TPR) repeat protein n=1 Tax=Nocardioides marmoribigeumensis TaxID=433649 RepID=A0ABU2BWK1_9ACTN|nr:helix-turn-helix domain-containing protein [Nocardioides marmoribigeumensis]MDR7362796.1 tetratricopeptide (TPR) repeat protein [Nocardioides marmoribigeumensis]